MKKKLIEVSLPLEAINVASAREKSIRHGHPSTLHLWWARRPLAACRAVLFASLVDDPSSLPEQFPTEEEQIKERRRLHEIIERLVLWENSNNETVLAEARAEIMRSTNNNPPPVYDPFAGGGSIPLEAQRLGLEAHASDLNPVAVLINKALIEIPPKFAGQPPVNAASREKLDHTKSWKGAAGLAEDVRYYGKWMRDEAEKRIGHLYPKVKAIQEADGSFRHATDEEIASERRHLACDSSNTIHSRGYLPHFELENKLQTVTFRLHDSLPKSVLERIERELDQKSEDDGFGETETGLDEREVERRKRIEKYLDAGHGECYLRDEQIAETVQNALLHFDGERYELHEWVVMPNHVHVLFRPLAGQTLSKILHSWKSFTANEANKMLGRTGDFWQIEYYDRYIRNQEHYDNAVRYIRENPVKAGLVKKAEDWKFSSARKEKKDAGRMPALRRLTVIAWLWARTVKCPNPTCGAMMPLVRSFALSTKKGKEAWVEPIIERRSAGILPASVRFEIRTAKENAGKMPALPAGTVDRRGARCLVCSTGVPLDHVRAEGKAGRMVAQMMAIVAEGVRGRIYLAPNEEQANIAAQAEPTWKPDAVLPLKHRNFQTPGYGMTNVGDLFTNRQLVALTTFSDLISEAREKVLEDAQKTEVEKAEFYANAIAIYLSFAIDKGVDYWSNVCSWHSSGEKMRNTFGRQAIPMVWDFAECCVFSNSTGNWTACTEWVSKSVSHVPACSEGYVKQIDAATLDGFARQMFSTDPPYYDNIYYADLSDYFYVWLRRALKTSVPDLFGTLLVPKSQELVASPYRFEGSKEKAKKYFEAGLNQVFRKMCEMQDKEFPVTVYYAFKQSENEDDNEDGNEVVTASTGWETMLEGLINSGFQITGTIPMRSELSNRMVASGANALASSIVLVCRPRSEDTPTATRGEFLRALKKELPDALRKLQESNIAPVDLAQASIGPGMAVYSRYKQVVESDGSPMKVRAALGIINQILDEVLAEQDSDYDSETRWAIDWFAQFGMNAGAFGDAETLSKAKNTSVAGMETAGIISSRAGKVKLLSRDELKPDWNPDTDSRLTVWEITQHLIRTLETEGEQAAAKILQKESIGYLGDIAKELAYRLYNFCERKGWAQEALAYNSLVVSWNDVQKQASELAKTTEATQSSFDFE